MKRLSTILVVGTGVAASPAAAQSLCTILPGGIINCPPPAAPAPTPPPGVTPLIDVTASVVPLAATLEDNFFADGPLNLGTIAGADVDIVSQGLSTINSVGSGLVVDSGRNLTAEVTNISTIGDNATAALLRAADSLIFASDGLISTLGLNSDGVNAEGDSVTLDLGTVTTVGPNAQGVEVGSLAGPASVTVDLIDTSGNGSIGALIRGTGDVGLSGNLIRTRGTDALAFDISNDAAACVVLGVGGCDNTVTLDSVTTDGFGSIGGLVSAVGDTNIDIGVLRTGGDEAAGLDLSVDPAACVVLGAGACDTAFSVGDLSTEGARSPGALVRGVGDITADVGVLRTGGDEAVGLDLASDPTACAVLGAGACDTSFSVGQLTTEGDGATGLLLRAAGDTTGDIGVLRTSGDDAAGVDIATDPTACVIAGVGACDVGLAADDIETSGDGAAGVLINNAGAALVDIGRLVTGGAGSTGLSIVQDPGACLALGPGVCRVQAEADDVETEGPDSPGVVIVTPGPVDTDTGSVDTGGDNSPGVVVTSPGPIDVTTGPVTTGGDNSDGVQVNGGAGPVTVNAGPVTTTGDNSDGIDVTTTTGDVTITAGPVNVSGVGSDGIVVTSGCGAVDITARDDIISGQATAILATTGCTARVTTLPGATVRGATAGIDVTAGGGSTVVIADNVSSTTGPAIDLDGGASSTTVTPTGSVTGRIDLTDSADTLTNNGLLDFTGTSSFGAGTDLLTNNGRFRARGATSLTGLEQFANNGLIDMVDGAADDQLTISGNYVAGAGSRLAVDVTTGPTGPTVDTLVIGGTASGATIVTLNPIAGPAVANPTGALLVDAAAGSTATFTLAGPVRSGFIDYSLSTANGDTRLLALPNQFAIEPLLTSRMALDFWYQSADAWSEGAAYRRNRTTGGIGGWAMPYGAYDTRGQRETVDVFGTPVSVDLEYETERSGIQAGLDFGSERFAFGVTGGYQRAEARFSSGTSTIVEGYNVGGSLLWNGGNGFYGEVLAKVDFFDLELVNGSLFGNPDIGGTSYGAEAEIGHRSTTAAGARIDLHAGIAYVRSEVDGFNVAGGAFAFDEVESLRGRVGARITGEGPNLAPFADVKLFHQFLDTGGARFASGGFTLPYSQDGGTSARIEAGFGPGGSRGGLFVSAYGEAGDVMGLGARLGFRF